MTNSFYIDNPYPMHGNHGGLYEKELRHFFESLSPHRILDAGCGTGAMTCQLAMHFPEASVLAVDRSTASIELARQRHGGLPNVTFEVLDLETEVPGGGDVFDFIFCQGVLHHMNDPAAALRNIYAATSQDMAGYIWLYSRHGRVEIAQIRELLAIFGAENRPVEDLLAILETVRPAYSSLYAAEERDLLDWAGDDPAWTRDDERKARYMDRYVNPIADHYSIRDAAELLRGTGFTITAVPTLEAVELEPALAQLIASSVVDPLDRYAAMELVIRPWGIGYLVRKGQG
ncbi:class I SAM-dependent methyltransferase [Nonomuraea angiospora]|uniref:SAM-dependent methyltransferase n=1 Tax=Nonomuraea angiospora TaxID=46172 RepID=A0ABR9LNN6_9ACTN|nr:class I SAM-dependent methyltransferase [Nonomuraea angiospora]MBE1582258.1 SAM-dependent methyltransferase [Nonomuraea angiospora]